MRTVCDNFDPKVHEALAVLDDLDRMAASRQVPAYDRAIMWPFMPQVAPN